jgi:MSHA pilin protein MshB
MRRQSGFTIIEIIIVVIILGLLAATALPRFLDMTDDAEDAAIDGIAGGFASAVGLARGQWEIDGRPSGNVSDGAGGLEATGTFITVDGVTVGVNAASGAGIVAGFPTGDSRADTTITDASITHAECLNVLENIMQNAPRAIEQTSPTRDLDDLTGFSLFVQEGTGATNNQCFYYQTNGLVAIPAAGVTTNLNGFTYNPATGAVTVFQNKAN